VNLVHVPYRVHGGGLLRRRRSHVFWRRPAQRTEEDAQSALRASQAKYAVLAGYQMQIRKKDQGGRGVFYAAQVGPLPRVAANGLCSRIKSAGGKCFTQEN
jgi:hypothetical protein